MTTWRRLAIIAALAAFTLAVTACGKSGSGEQSDRETAEGETARPATEGELIAGLDRLHDRRQADTQPGNVEDVPGAAPLPDGPATPGLSLPAAGSPPRPLPLGHAPDRRVPAASASKPPTDLANGKTSPAASAEPSAPINLSPATFAIGQRGTFVVEKSGREIVFRVHAVVDGNTSILVVPGAKPYPFFLAGRGTRKMRTGQTFTLPGIWEVTDLRQLGKRSYYVVRPYIKPPSPAELAVAEAARKAAEERRKIEQERRKARLESETPITMAEYSGVTIGMEYDQVFAVIGVHGREQSRSTVGGTTLATFIWSNRNGSNMAVTLKNGHVMSKAQLGLR